MTTIETDKGTLTFKVPFSLATVLRLGSINCEEFQKEFHEFEQAMEYDCAKGGVFRSVSPIQKNAEKIIAKKKWREFLQKAKLIDVTIKPKTKISIGDVFCITRTLSLGFRSEWYLLAQSNLSRAMLIAIAIEPDSAHYDYLTGLRWRDEVTVQDTRDITKDEFKLILGPASDNYDEIIKTQRRLSEVLKIG